MCYTGQVPARHGIAGPRAQQQLLQSTTFTCTIKDGLKTKAI